MKTQDARSLPAPAQEALRRRVVQAVRQGLTQAEAARLFVLARRFGVHVSVWTVGRYLRAWGLTPQKPVRRAYEQNPVAVRRWLEQEYPAIRAQAKREKAEIHWGEIG